MSRKFNTQHDRLTRAFHRRERLARLLREATSEDNLTEHARDVLRMFDQAVEFGGPVHVTSAGYRCREAAEYIDRWRARASWAWALADEKTAS